MPHPSLFCEGAAFLSYTQAKFTPKRTRLGWWGIQSDCQNGNSFAIQSETLACYTPASYVGAYALEESAWQQVQYHMLNWI